jgi:hypothetical protein
MPERSPELGFTQTLSAAAAAARLLAEAGLETGPTEGDLNRAEDIVRMAASDPGALRATSIMNQTPAAVLLTRQILEDYGHRVVEEAQAIRHLVTNKLVQETANPKPEIRLRALELLGKIGDVGLFTERREVTITHQSADDVKDRLRARLARLLPVEAPVEEPLIEDAEIVEDTATAADDEEELVQLSLEARLASKSLFEGS